jgi:hypothetical protein
MSNFIKYENLDFSINGATFFAEKISLGVTSSPSPVLVDDGTLLNYAPNGSLVGSLNADFYLTNTSNFFFYIDVTGLNENANTGVFGGVTINNLYPKSISFSVRPMEPILINAEFDWYGTIAIDEITEQTRAARAAKAIPSYYSHAHRSYIDETDLDLSNIISLDYSASCVRPAFFNVDSIVPFRVAKGPRNAKVSISAGNLGELIEIYGKTAKANIFIKDFYNTSLWNFNISGVMTDQSYNVVENSSLIGRTTIYQEIGHKKTLI